MQLSEATIAILKNFASINQSILFREGNVLKTISPQKNIIGKATVEETFPKEVAIYDLNRLLGVVSLFKNPNIEFMDNHISICDGKNSVRYVYADQSIIVFPPAKDVKFPSTDAEFAITEEQMSQVMKAAGVINLADISFVGDGKVLRMKAHDKKNPSSNEYSIELCETNQKFSVDFKVENFKMVTGNYNVRISRQLLSHFSGAIEYYIACESTSKFE